MPFLAGGVTMGNAIRGGWYAIQHPGFIGDPHGWGPSVVNLFRGLSMGRDIDSE